MYKISFYLNFDRIGKEERYKKNKSRLQMWFHFDIVTIQNKIWFYRIAYKDQFVDDSVSFTQFCSFYTIYSFSIHTIYVYIFLQHIDVILYYIRKKAKYSDSDNNEFNFIVVDCNFNKLIENVWDAYYNLDSTVNKDSKKESIIEYINGYIIHVAAPWHTVDNILIPVNIEQIFHWVLIVVSINERCIHVYDSLRGSSLHDSSVSNEIKKYAQLIPMYLS